MRALNEDLPYDVFLERQIAADRLPSGEDRGTLAALGFLTVGRRFNNNKHDIIDDRLDVLCRTTMGLTISCARCHDHKFDPISIKDYYSLYGVFASSTEPEEADQLMTMADEPNPHNERVFIRGNSGNRGDEAVRQFLPCLAGDKLKPFTPGERPAGAGSGHCQPRQPADGPGDCEPRLAALFRRRAWSARPAISACAAIRRPIRSCSTIWPGG